MLTRHAQAKTHASGVFFAWIFSALALCSGSLQAAVPTMPETLVRQALDKHFPGQGTVSTVQEDPMAAATVRAIAQRNLDPAILVGVQSSTGTEFRVARPGNGDAQVAVLVFSYPDAETPQRLAQALQARGGYFTGSKILTVFSRAVIERKLVVLFTEDAGDKEIVDFIRGFSVDGDGSPAPPLSSRHPAPRTASPAFPEGIQA